MRAVEGSGLYKFKNTIPLQEKDYTKELGWGTRTVLKCTPLQNQNHLHPIC
jgi:hypothetical protein